MLDASGVTSTGGSRTAPCVGVGLIVAAVGFQRSGQLYLGLGLAVWVVLLAMWVRLPRTALGVTITWRLIADIVTVSWFPFLKNFSSLESITYLSDSLTVSPFELTLVWALGCTAYRNVSATGRPFVSGSSHDRWSVCCSSLRAGWPSGSRVAETAESPCWKLDR